MEREDAVTKLQHQNNELLEELKGARSGQDRSAEEVRKAVCVSVFLPACLSVNIYIFYSDTCLLR